jgi:hypothetical protein
MPHLFILSVSIQHTKTPVDCVHHVNGTSIIAFVLIRLLCVSILSLCFLDSFDSPLDGTPHSLDRVVRVGLGRTHTLRG